MLRRIMHTLVIGIILLICLEACSRQAVQPSTYTPTPSPATAQASDPLATPYAQQPAAGICASFEEMMVTVTLNPDLPDPRCSKVRPDQTLTVLNNTENTLQISIGRFASSLEPGEKTMIDTPFGEYLETGVHQLQVLPCCGAELWLEETK